MCVSQAACFFLNSPKASFVSYSIRVVTFTSSAFYCLSIKVPSTLPWIVLLSNFDCSCERAVVAFVSTDFFSYASPSVSSTLRPWTYAAMFLYWQAASSPISPGTTRLSLTSLSSFDQNMCSFVSMCFCSGPAASQICSLVQLRSSVSRA